MGTREGIHCIQSVCSKLSVFIPTKIEQERIWNETHDEDGNLIENEDENEQNDDDKKEDKSEEEQIPKRYWYEKKAKLVKKKAKTHKMLKEMCYFLNEQFDVWMHEKQKEISQIMKEGDKIEDYFEPLAFCKEGKVCKEAMFDIEPKIFKFKKELKLPTKPKRKWEPPTLTDYEEQMEDDVEDTSDEDNNEESNDKKSEL